MCMHVAMLYGQISACPVLCAVISVASWLAWACVQRANQAYYLSVNAPQLVPSLECVSEFGEQPGASRG